MPEVISSSFIPKKEFNAPKKKTRSFSINIFFLISLIIFLATIIGAVGVHMWKKNLTESNAIVQAEFVKKSEQFGLEAIMFLSTISERIKVSRKLLENHHNILPIFTFLEKKTLTNIYYTDLFINEKKSDSNMVINAKGVASSLVDLSQQADSYSKNSNINNLVISNITRSADGLVFFELYFEIDKKFLTTKSFIN